MLEQNGGGGVCVCGGGGKDSLAKVEFPRLSVISFADATAASQWGFKDAVEVDRDVTSAWDPVASSGEKSVITIGNKVWRNGDFQLI